MSIVIEEADEAEFWLEMLADAGLVPKVRLRNLISEANELTALFNASRLTASKGGSINNQESTIGKKVS
jgi:hypothetical protein